MHVYHYAAYEVSALKRLTCEYGTREDELDELLRAEVFVDLYKVVSQGLRLSHPRYGLKQVETFYFDRTADLRAGDDSIVLYEDYLEHRDPGLLDDIAEYNTEDCVSTLELRDWLLPLRPALAPEPEPPEQRDPPDDTAETEQLRQALLAGLPDDPHAIAAADRSRWLMAQLILYHRREAKPVWWAFFDKIGRTAEELQERDSEAIGGIEQTGPATAAGSSQLYPFAFPAQQHHLAPRTSVYDPATGKPAGVIEELDDEAGTLLLRRGRSLADEPLPGSLMPGGPYSTPEQQAALRRLSRAVLSGSASYPAARSILEREPHPQPLPQDDLDAARRLVAGLDGKHLFIQGPPGSGKTYTGARLIAHLISLGRRVGVTSTGHKAIHNLIEAVEETGVAFRGLKKGDSYESGSVTTSGNQALFSTPEDDVLLLGGTAWLFSREDMEGVVDTLFIDEAGQMSLADALAVSTCARNVVLLGDPQQLGQVSQGIHPEGAAASVLEHLLGDEDTVPPNRGLFLVAHVAHAPGRLQVHLGDLVRGSPPVGPRVCTPADRLARDRGCRTPLHAHRAPRESCVVDRGGRPHRRRDRPAHRRDVHRQRRRRSTDRLERHPRRHAVQRPGAVPARPDRAGRADRHGRQVPGPGGADRVLLDGDIERRGSAAERRVPLLAEPSQRGDLESPGAGGTGRQPQAARDSLSLDRADAHGQCALPVRGGSR